MLLPGITWESTFYTCINQMIDDAGYILGATVAKTSLCSY